jgi:hypothetical protein
MRDAQKVIFPGKNGDAWWDSAQMLEQLKNTIDIHKVLHPGKQALFIFDQSSAHGSLPPNVICPFDMNKSDGSKQPFAHSTTIPTSSLDSTNYGQVQEMTYDPDKVQKGLKRTLEECGFDVSGLHTKCSPICSYEEKGCCIA